MSEMKSTNMALIFSLEVVVAVYKVEKGVAMVSGFEGKRERRQKWREREVIYLGV